MIIWLTGQPGSGKTTLARELYRRRIVDCVIDGDELRATRPEGYNERGRHRNVERAQDIARWVSSQGMSVAVALVSPYRAQREGFKTEGDVLEVHLESMELRGKEDRFVVDYERPLMNLLWLNTAELSVDECIASIVEALPVERK